MEEEPVAAAKMAIGSRLREERLRLGMTQADFAEFGGVAKRTALEWEQGKTSPNAVFLAAASRQGIDILYVVNGVRLSDTNTAPPADEQAIVEAWRGLTLAQKGLAKRLLAAIPG
jgi:transcriptional regulator with XRE-family HTH domain